MSWNVWTRATPLRESEAQAAMETTIGDVRDLVTCEVDERRAIWTFSKGQVEQLAERLGGDRALGDDWRRDMGDVDGDTYSAVVRVIVEESGSRFVWDPKDGDNNASWPIAWLFTTRFIRAVGAELEKRSAAFLLDEMPSTEVPLPLPVVPLRRDSLLPTGRPLPVDVGRPASVGAVTAALANHAGHCIVVTQRDAATDQPSLEELHRVGCVARVIAATGRSVVFLGTSRIVLSKGHESEEGVLFAGGSLADGGTTDREVTKLLLVHAEILLLSTLPMDEIPEDALDVLTRMPAERVPYGVAEVFAGFLDASTRARVLTEDAPIDRATLLVDALRQINDAIDEKMEENGDDLVAARTALLAERDG